MSFEVFSNLNNSDSVNMEVQTPFFISLFSKDKSVTNMSRGKRIEFQNLGSKLWHSFPAAHKFSSSHLPISLLDFLLQKKMGKGKYWEIQGILVVAGWLLWIIEL